MKKRENNSISRRSLLSTFALGLSTIGLSQGVSAMDCKPPSPTQPEGPFYPERRQEDEDNNLVRINGATTEAKGQRILIEGLVTDEDCQPIEGALVEIWQACESGRYNHSKDPNRQAPLDPHFQYWGRAYTDNDGRYSFLSIIPGQYPAAPGWIRPAHIHYKAMKRGYRELTTQMYFKGDPYNATDAILQDLPLAEQEKLIVDFEPVENSPEKLLRGQFNLTLKKIRL